MNEHKKSFASRLRALSGALALLGGAACSSSPPTVPVEVPFGLGRGGESVEFDFRVKETYGYVVELKIFFHKKGDWEDWKKLDPLLGKRFTVGNTLSEVGVPITLRIRVNSIEVKGPPVDFDHTTDRIGFVVANDEYATKRVQMRINDQKLLPGTYRIRVDNLHPVPEFADRKVHIEISHAEQGK